MSERCYIGLGSNLDQPCRQLQRALTAIGRLPQTTLIAVSPFYGSRAIGPGDQPDYANAVAEIATTLSPEALLAALQTVERDQGRVRRVRWGPRTLDLDILLYGHRVLNLPGLTVPHPRLKERPFVIAPLHDLAPELRLPDGTSLASLLDYAGNDDLWRLPPLGGE